MAQYWNPFQEKLVSTWIPGARILQCLPKGPRETSHTSRPISPPFCFASLTRFSFNVLGVSSMNSSKLISKSPFASARAKILSTCFSPSHLKPNRFSAAITSCLSRYPESSVSAILNSCRSTVLPVSESAVATKDLMMSECRPMIFARIWLSCSSPRTDLPATTMGENTPSLCGLPPCFFLGAAFFGRARCRRGRGHRCHGRLARRRHVHYRRRVVIVRNRVIVVRNRIDVRHDDLTGQLDVLFHRFGRGRKPKVVAQACHLGLTLDGAG